MDGKVTLGSATLPVYKGPKLEKCLTGDCSEWATSETARIYGIGDRNTLFPEDAWYRNSALIKGGGKEIWSEGKPIPSADEFQVGDAVSMRGSGMFAKGSRSKTGLPMSANEENSHMGIIIGKDGKSGNPVVRHKIRNKIVTDVLDSAGMARRGVGRIVRPAAIMGKLPLTDKDYNWREYGDTKKLDVDLNSHTPKVVDSASWNFGGNWKEKSKKFVESLQRNSEAVGRAVNLTNDEMEVLSSIALGVYGNESTFGTSSTRGLKEAVKKLTHSFKLPGRLGVEPSRGVTRLKYDMAANNKDGSKTRIGRAFDNLAISKHNSGDLDTTSKATLAVLAENYKRLKNDSSYDSQTGTVWGIPIEHAVIDSWKNRFPSKGRKGVLQKGESDYVKNALDTMQLFKSNTVFPKTLEEIVITRKSGGILERFKELKKYK